MKRTWLINSCSSGLGQHLAASVLARGDRAKAVDVILHVVDNATPPLHLVLGLVAMRLSITS